MKKSENILTKALLSLRCIAVSLYRCIADGKDKRYCKEFDCVISFNFRFHFLSICTNIFQYKFIFSEIDDHFRDGVCCNKPMAEVLAGIEACKYPVLPYNPVFLKFDC